MQTKRSVCYDENAEKIIDLLHENGYKAYYVGGCVRDALMGKKPHDFDLATDALPAQTEEIFRKKGYSVVQSGIRHGTVSVVLDKIPYEITTFRTEGAYRDHRRPEEVRFVGSVKDDMARRDFTINALAYQKAEGLLDYFAGRADLEHRIVRCVGEPEVRLREDALRILRALRFAAVLNFTIEKHTAAAIHACKDLLRMISAERIWAEFTGILTAQRPSGCLREYIDVFGVFLPELLPSVGFQQNNPWHIYDVFEHTMTALDHTPCDLTLRLAVLFHDIGKPYAYTQDSAGVGHFKGHAAISATLAEQILTRLHCDKHTQKSVCLLIRHHDDRIPAETAAVKKLIRRMGAENALRAVQVELADKFAQNPERGKDRRQELDSISAMVEALMQPGAACITYADLAVNGDDLLAAGIPQGARIGKILKLLLELVTEEKLPNEREALLQFVRDQKDGL
ncbi:MAG: CCA tRNA nucleotidyltransferase [Clostridia bacterium]